MSTKTFLTNCDLFFRCSDQSIFYCGVLGEESNEFSRVLAICRSQLDLLILFHSRTLSELLSLPLPPPLLVFSCVKWDSHRQAAQQHCCGDKIMNAMRYFATTKPRLYFPGLVEDNQIIQFMLGNT